MSEEKRPYEIPINRGEFAKGKKNSLTDVKGIKVGHLTISKDIHDDSGEIRFVRTGLTAILPYLMNEERRLFAGGYFFRGNTEITGYEVIDDFCYLNSPIVLANSYNVGKVYNAILTYGFSLGRTEIWPPLVIEVNDSYLSDPGKSSVDEEEVLQLFRNSSSENIVEGSAGIGLGLQAFGWKGGVGSSSRVLSWGKELFSLGTLVATNCGNKKAGSLNIIVAVDIPLIPHQIKKITSSLVLRLPQACINRCSDSITCFLFSTANPMSMEKEGPPVFEYLMGDDSLLERIIQAGTEAVKEAIINSLLKASTIEGRLGRKVETIPEVEFKKLIKEFQVNF